MIPVFPDFLSYLELLFSSFSSVKENKSNAFSIAINQTANFNNEVHYKGLNNYSSFSEQFAEELAKSGLPVSDFLYTNSSAPYSIAPAWNS